MIKQEQNFTSKFLQWVKDNYKGTAAFEIKHTRGKSSLPFAEVKDHQMRALNVVRHNQLVYKIADSALGYKPFDAFCITEQPAYVVIKYPKGFVLIGIDNFYYEAKVSKRRSLTWERAKDLAWKTVEK